MAINTTRQWGALAVLLAPMVALAAPHYTVAPIGSIGGASGDLNDINNAGQIVGYALSKANTVNAYLSVDGVSTNLHPAGASASYAAGINDAGLIAGYVTTAAGTHAVTFANGGVNSLGTLNGSSGDSFSAAINAAGQVAGTSQLSDNTTQRAFLYTPGGGMSSLGTLGGLNSVGNDINQAGSVAGHADVGAGSYHAYTYADGVMSDLGTLGGNYSSATALNDHGLVTGFAYTAGDSYAHSFLYQNGVMSDLQTLGGLNSYGMGINKLGQVVGRSELLGGGSTHAFLYANGSMTDLNSLVEPGFEYVLRYAADINDAGQIAALGCSVSGTFCQGFMLTLAPVPEPETWLLMGLGGALVGLAARRQRRFIRQARRPAADRD